MSDIKHISPVRIDVDESLKKMRKQWWPNIFGPVLITSVLTLISWAATHPLAGNPSYSGAWFCIVVGAFLAFILGVCIDQVRIWTTPERAWHLQSVALAKKVELFNARLAALQAIARNMEENDHLDAAVSKECEDVHKMLMRQLRAHARSRAIRQFEAVVAKDPDPQFRSTRQDLASHILVARIRVADQEAGTEVVNTSLEEDSRFTALEKAQTRSS